MIPSPAQMAALHRVAFSRSRPWSRDEFADFLASPFCFVVGDDTGFALGRVIVDEAELLTIATHPDIRRTGQGRRWLAAFHDTAAARGATTAFLEVAADNTAAITLYLATGYTDQALRRGYYARPDGPAVDARIMRKPLP